MSKLSTDSIEVKGMRGFVGKRRFRRALTNLPVNFYWGSDLREGVVRDLSGNGMYIESEICPAGGSDIEVVLIVGDEVFNISGKVKRMINSNGSSGGMGVELLCPSVNYRKFVCIVQDYAYNGPCSKPCLKMHKRVIPTDSPCGTNLRCGDYGEKVGS